VDEPLVQVDHDVGVVAAPAEPTLSVLVERVEVPATDPNHSARSSSDGA